MKDLNWKTWGLIFAVSFGLAFEGLKHVSSQGRAWEKGISFSGEDSPYQVKFKKYPKAPTVMPGPAEVSATRLGGSSVTVEALEKFIAANATVKAEFGHVDKGAEGMPTKNGKGKVKKKKGEDDEYEIIVDPATGKRYRRKKKKVAKVEEVKQEETYKEQPKKEEPKSNDDSDAGLSTMMNGGQAPAPDNKADSPYADLEEWQRRLLSYPNMAETRRFIEHYKNNIVTADIFYKIVAMMLEDSRQDMRELGVLCAGMTPSVMSFQVLAEVVKTDSGSLRTYADNYLNRYGDLNNLAILERVMTAPPNSFVAITAAKKLEASAANYLAPAKNKAVNTASTQAGHSNASYYRRFVTVLQSMVRGTDNTVNETARVTLAHLNTLMSGTPIDPNAPATIAGDAPAQASTQP